MSSIIIPPKWAIPAREMTEEKDFLNRRQFIQRAGLTSLAIGSGLAACAKSDRQAQAEDPLAENAESPAFQPQPAPGLYPAQRNAKFSKLDRPLTDEKAAGLKNNFYEFANSSSHGMRFQSAVTREAKDYAFRPWVVEIGGLVESPRKMSIDEIEKLAPLEERLYRFRCVETWAMAVPWTGYPLRKLIESVKPKPEAKYLRFISFLDRNLTGIKAAPFYRWPYYEALRLDEAMNELAMLVTGIYGHALSPQHGAPLRIIAPWKYGYKNPKSLAKIEFVAEEPGTFWHDDQPGEYGFYSNVNPNNPHPRWSQATEWLIPNRRRRPTAIFNGYADFVGGMYPNEPRKPGPPMIL